MTRTYTEIPESTGFDVPNGGIIRVGEGNVSPPELVACTPTGTAFGPLYIGVPTDEVVTVTDLSFAPGEDGSSLLPLIAGGGVLAATNTRRQREQAEKPEEVQTTRRGALAVLATALAAGLGISSAAAEDLVTLEIVDVEIAGLTGPLSIRVLDVVDEVLPPTTDLLVDATGTRVGSIADPGEGVQLPASTDGEIRVYLQDSVGNLTRLLSWVRGLVGSASVEGTHELPQQASDYDEGEFVRMSSHPVYVEAVRRSEPSGTVVHIGNTEIPHEDEGENGEFGSYGILDDALIYTVGENPPAASEWTIRTQLGLLDRTRERI